MPLTCWRGDKYDWKKDKGGGQNALEFHRTCWMYFTLQLVWLCPFCTISRHSSVLSMHWRFIHLPLRLLTQPACAHFPWDLALFAGVLVIPQIHVPSKWNIADKGNKQAFQQYQIQWRQRLDRPNTNFFDEFIYKLIRKHKTSIILPAYQVSTLCHSPFTSHLSARGTMRQAGRPNDQCGISIKRMTWQRAGPAGMRTGTFWQILLLISLNTIDNFSNVWFFRYG